MKTVSCIDAFLYRICISLYEYWLFVMLAIKKLNTSLLVHWFICHLLLFDFLFYFIKGRLGEHECFLQEHPAPHSHSYTHSHMDDCEYNHSLIC